MKKLKTLVIFVLLITCLAFAGCSSTDNDENKVTDRGGTSISNEKTSATKDKTDDESLKDASAPADDPATAALKAYAKGITSLFCSEFNVTYDDIRYMLADFSGDGQPELLAVGVYDADMSYMEIYAYSEGGVSKIFEGQCGAANGMNMHPIRYEGVPYVMKESISSSTGFYQQLMHYNGTDWFTVHSSFVEFDFYNNFEKKGCIVDDAPASDAAYDAVRKKVDEGYMRLNEFVSANDL